jgi:HEAT repeat protein
MRSARCCLVLSPVIFYRQECAILERGSEAETVALMERATPAMLAMIIDLLDHPFWEVRERAVKTLGTLRRNIPDSAIRRLLELRKDPEAPDVRAAADQALAEILSLEQGIEDE